MQKRPGTLEHHLGSNASRRWRGVVRRVFVNVSALGILSLGLVAIDSIAPQVASAAPSLSTLTIPTTGLNPVPQTTPRVFPVALSCPSATSCVSTGQYYDLNGAYQGFIGVGTLSGGQWSWTLSTLNVGSTTGLSPAALSNVSVGPDSISCPSTTSCLLTGDYEDVNYHVDGFVAAGTLSGGVWTWVLSTLSTSGLSPAAVSNPVTTSSISCPSTTSCLLTGQYYVTNTNSYGFFATGSLSGGVWTWTLKTLPNTGANPAPQSGTGVSAASLSCPSTTSCIMTGSYVATSPNTYGFVGVGTLSGGVWSWAMSTLVTTTLNPIPSSATSSTVVSINPYSLSCPAVNSCVVVGGYLDTNQNNDGFIVVGTLSASTWTWSASTLSTTALVPASNPSPSSYTNPDVISCPSTTSCVAMGTYENTSANNDAMVITGTLSAGTWTWIPSEAPTTGLNPASITAQGLGPGGISCPSAARCVATGSYQANIPGGGLGAEGFATSIVTLPTASVPTITNLPSSGIVGGSFVAQVSTTGDGAVSVVSNSPSVCSVSGLTITYLAVGTCSLTASVADGINYAGAVGTAQTFSLSAEVTTTTTTTVVTKVGQSKLFISNTRVIFPLHAKVTLTTRGGSGTGAVSFKLLHGACVLRGNQLSVHTAHACTVIANKAGDSHYTPQNSSPVTFLIGFKVQAPLSLRVSSKVARHSARVSLSTSGGSGRGAVHFSVKGKHCFLRGDTLGASRATSCVVSATKAGSGSYLAVTSKSVKVKFT